ncbi:MAG: excinuclease ABC subunit A, partial [Gammaproteobacteria bacterium RIFCSPHIGHO2_12_FULL_42_10]
MKQISIRGARTHNLKNINVDLPRDQLVVITGLSGSGKSSLAFDTLYAEGERRYVESLSAYARQFLSMMEKPDVDHIEGLSPAIAIQQKATSHNPRSTVGTITEIYDYLRLLFAKVGEPRCPTHNTLLHAQTISQMVDTVLVLPEGTGVMILSPIIRERKGEHVELLQTLREQGFLRARIDGHLIDLDQAPALDLRKKHTIEVVVDRIKVRSDLQNRLAESFETALRLSGGIAELALLEDPSQVTHHFSAKFACSQCGYSVAELSPRLFSFNSPLGCCEHCDGLGWQSGYDPDFKILQLVVQHSCKGCHGTRLNQMARNVFVAEKSLPEVASWPIDETHRFFKDLHLLGARGEIAAKIVKELVSRLHFLLEVGLEYLSLDRSAETLSGGEAQRIRLASQIGSGLVGVMYILDEPSIGLHQRDNEKLLNTLKKLRNLGNTVIVVEHDLDAMLQADYILDLGPGAGVHGGHIVAQGKPSDVILNNNSLTGQYLSGKRAIAVPLTRKPIDTEKQIMIRGACGNNLKNISVEIPVGLMTCITGVSGSGKSTLINDTLAPTAARLLNGATRVAVARCDEVTGLEYLDKLVVVDQSPIGRTPRSNPATYTGLFSDIRELFAGTLEARSRGYQLGRFSFNVEGGRCEACSGEGVVKVEMHFLADVYVTCDICQGKRYNRETLEILYKGKNIHQVLEMTVEEARSFFDAIPAAARKLQTLLDVGLSYVTLGQSATTLSGGEAQRVKLATELSRRDTGRVLYVLDEPTTGLHFYDVEQLLKILHRLRDHGNTV